MTVNGRSRSWNLVSPSFCSTGKSWRNHLFSLGLARFFFCILVSGLDGDGIITGDSAWRFLLKSVFKNKKNCFNSYFLLWIKMLTAGLSPMIFNRQIAVWEDKIGKIWFYPPLTRGSNWIFELSGMIVSANLGLETSLPFKRTTEQKSTLSRVSKRDAMVRFSDHGSCLLSTSIMYYTTPFFFKTSRTSGKSMPRRLTVATVGMPLLSQPRRS